ncbi:hypothetical protein [Aurantiacibacter sp. D1-12]|uniref:hypothetical protein n=1 Tax=Aurantiacibacter sp. D1-12 TaxID=2993658 RepID=UPI00237C8AC8|nr:hypothetical protein [Aurantiacibacter sp. D1-12]MDE1467788.1 hypothetical protein [Aurantiacibacter sp. D1-12]
MKNMEKIRKTALGGLTGAMLLAATPSMAFADTTDDPNDPTNTPERCLINVPLPNGEWYRALCFW